MDLKISQYISSLSLELMLSPTKDDEVLRQQQYLHQLREALTKVLTNLQTNVQQINQKYVKRQELERLTEDHQESLFAATQQNQNLQRENHELKASIEQYQRYFKRYEIKFELLNNKIFHLNKIVSEKEAIIKYLQSKAESTQRYSVKPAQLNETIIDDFSRTYSKSNLSFAKLRSKTNLKFQDYANLSLQVEEEDHGLGLGNIIKGRVDRIKTESNDTKENQKVQNLKSQPGTKKLHDFFNSNVLSSLENQKTLTKAHSSQQSESFWKYSSKPKQTNENMDRRRNSNLNSSKCLTKLISNEFRH